MKRILLTIATVALLSISCSRESGTSYYVAPTGSDSNIGTIDEPFRTIAKASSLMVAGDECVIREGVYRETIMPLLSGSEGKPLTYRNYKNEKVCVDAADTILSWTLHKGDIYKAKVRNVKHALPAEWQALYYNETVIDEARWPNNLDNNNYTFEGYYITGGSTSHVFTEKEDFPDIDLTGAAMTYLGQHCGTTWTRPILKSNRREIHFPEVNPKKWPFTSHNPTLHRGNHKGQIFLYGHLGLLDRENEWCYDAKTKTIYAQFPDNAKPADGSVKFNARIHVVNAVADYIVIDGLSFFGGEVRMEGDHNTIRNCRLKNCVQIRDRFDNCFSTIEEAAIVMTGNHITIERNLLEYGSCNGIMTSGGSYCTIDNNVVRYFNTVGIHANPVASTCHHTKITRNTIHTAGRDGITTSGINTEVAYNDVYNCMLLNNDGGIYYCVGDDAGRYTSIHHNWFHDSQGPAYADGRAAGIYLDNYSKGFDVYNNVIWNITWTGFQYNLYNTDFNFHNNTIWKAGASVGRWVAGYRMERINIANNVADKSASVVKSDNSSKRSVEDEWIGTNISDHNLIAKDDPFEDSANGNFMPKAGSALIDAGEVIEHFETKYVGKAPDLGAYEYGGERWKAGATWVDEI